MIGHLFTLWRKELRQQRWVLLGMALLYALMGVGSLNDSESDGASTSRLSQLVLVLRVLVPVLALTQAHVAVVREYRHKTQLFVEALPLSRWEVPLARLCWGLFTQSVLAGALWLSVALAAGESGQRFLLISMARLLAYVLMCWSIALGLATVGRLRWLAYATFLLGAVLLQQQGVEFQRFGPFALMDPLSMPFERSAFPLRALLESLLLAGVGLLLALGLPLWHEGSMAEVLARRASTGEKAGFWVVVAAQSLLIEALDRDEHREPFRFTDSAVVASERWNVQILYAQESLEPRARSLLDALERLAQGLTELGATAPPLRVAHNASLDAQTIRTASSALGAGALLEANLAAQELELGEVAFLAAHESFSQLSRGRAAFEPNHWLTDGFASYWAPMREARAGALPPHEQQASDARWLDALVARRSVSLDQRQLLEWERLAERVGEAVAVSIGFTLVQVLEQRHGRERLHALVRSLLVRPTVQDGFDWLFGERADLPASLQHHTGESWPELVAAHHAQLDAAAQRLAVPLAAIPVLEASLAVERTEVGNDIVYQLSGPAPAAPLACELRHLRLLPYDLAVGGDLPVHAIPWPAGKPTVEGRLRGRYAAGDRVFAGLDCRLPGLQRNVRLAARRLEVP